MHYYARAISTLYDLMPLLLWTCSCIIIMYDLLYRRIILISCHLRNPDLFVRPDTTPNAICGANKVSNGKCFAMRPFLTLPLMLWHAHRLWNSYCLSDLNPQHTSRAEKTHARGIHVLMRQNDQHKVNFVPIRAHIIASDWHFHVSFKSGPAQQCLGVYFA